MESTKVGPSCGSITSPQYALVGYGARDYFWKYILTGFNFGLQSNGFDLITSHFKLVILLTFKFQHPRDLHISGSHGFACAR